jgi:hypothetical protein
MFECMAGGANKVDHLLETTLGAMQVSKPLHALLSLHQMLLYCLLNQGMVSQSFLQI